MSVLYKAVGIVEQVVRERSGVQYLQVRTDAERRNALNYITLNGRLQAGDTVLLNTTATALKLGTGGYDFVIAALSTLSAACGGEGMGEGAEPAVVPMQPLTPTLSPEGKGSHLPLSPSEGEGTGEGELLMRLRYTPLQFAAPAAENRYPDALTGTLKGMPTVAILLHSHLIPVVGAIRYARPDARIVYIMTDSAALALGFSEVVSWLTERGWLAGTITVGQAFGGELEAVNLYSALLLARHALNADFAVVGQGPGNLGTGTRWGFSGLDQGLALNAIGTLGGQPIAALRISFGDTRARHQGVSHHSLTVLSQVALLPCTVAVPQLPADQMERVLNALQGAAIPDRHTLHIIDADAVLEWLLDQGAILTTMGRDADAERAYFLAGCAAGLLATRL